MSSQYTNGDRNCVENIAFVGAGGRVGGILASALIESGKFRVTALTRLESINIMPAGLHAIKKIDYNDHATCIAALQGQDVLLITMNVRAQPDAQQRLIDAAVEAGVKVIIPNEWAFDGADSTVGEESGFGTKTATIRKYIEDAAAARGSDMHWIAVTCGFWYEFSLVSSFVAPSSARFGFDHNAKTVTFFDDRGKTKIHTTTWTQLARAVVALVSLKIHADGPDDKGWTLSSFKNSAVCVSSFLVGQKDMFESLLRVHGQTERDWTVQYEDVKERFERGKKMAAEKQTFMEGSVIRMYSRVFWPDGTGDYSDKMKNEALELNDEDLDEATKRALEMLDTGSRKI